MVIPQENPRWRIVIGVELLQWPYCSVVMALISPVEWKRLKDSRRNAYYARYGKDRDGSLVKEKKGTVLDTVDTFGKSEPNLSS